MLQFLPRASSVSFPVSNGGRVGVGTKLDWWGVTAVVVEALLGRVVAVELGPMHLKAGGGNVTVTVNPGAKDIVIVGDAGDFGPCVVPGIR